MSVVISSAVSSADLETLKQDALLLLTASQCEDMELSILVTDDPGIQALNAQWRGKEQPTDVLSFPQEDEVLLGDLVLSLDTAARQALERGHSLRSELRILMIHGLLHLLGYDHELGPEDHQEMAEAEQRLMLRLDWEGWGLIEAQVRAVPGEGDDR